MNNLDKTTLNEQKSKPAHPVSRHILEQAPLEPLVAWFRQVSIYRAKIQHVPGPGLVWRMAPCAHNQQRGQQVQNQGESNINFNIKTVVPQKLSEMLSQNEK